MFNQTTIVSRLRDAFGRHRWLFLLSLLLVSGITTGVVLLRGKTYRASASTQVVTDNQQVAEALGEKYRNLYVSSAQQHVNHFTDLINDDLPGGFWDTALKNANLSVPINVDPRIKDDRFARLRKQLYANVDSSTMFSVLLTWDNPAECERIVESLQKQYSDEVGQEQQIKSLGTTNFLQKEIGDYEKRMQASEQVLINYKKAHSGLLPSAQAAEIDNLSKLKVERDKIIINANDGALKVTALERNLAVTKPKIVFEQTLTNSPSAVALAQLENSRIQLLASGVTPANNRVHDVDVQISKLRKAIVSEREQVMRNPLGTGASAGGNTNIAQTKIQDNPIYVSLVQQLTTARIEQGSAVERLKLANKQVSQYEGQIALFPEQEKELNSRTRDYNILKTQYESLKDRLEAARTKAELDKVTASDTLIRVGSIYAAPTQGQAKTLLMVLGSLLLGLVVATGMVVFAEWNDQTLRYPTDVERFLELPVLASVPESPAIDTSHSNGYGQAAPDALPEGSEQNPSLRFGRNSGGLAARNPSMGTFGP